MRRAASVTIIAIVLIISGVVVSFLRNQPVPKYTGSVEKIVIGNIGEYSIFNLIAKEKDIFLQNGLDVQIREYPFGAPALDDLLAGKIDFTIASDFSGVTYISSHKNLRILAQVDTQDDAFKLIARRDKGITNTVDLMGKRVGVTRKSSAEFFLGKFLVLNNLSLTDIKIVDLPPASLVSQITDGQVDAVVAFDPHAFNIMKVLGNTAVSLSERGEHKDFVMVYSTDGFIKSHPDTVKRYLASLVEAEKFVKANEQQSREIVTRILKYDNSYMEHLWLKANFVISLDQELLLTLEDQARWKIENKLIDQKVVPNYLNFIYFDALEAVKPGAITIIR